MDEHARRPRSGSLWPASSKDRRHRKRVPSRCTRGGGGLPEHQRETRTYTGVASAPAQCHRTLTKTGPCGGGCSELVVGLVLVLVAAAALAVVLGHDGRANALHLLVLLLDLLGVGLGIRVQPRLAVLQGVEDLLLLPM